MIVKCDECGATEHRLPATWLRVNVSRLVPLNRYVDETRIYCPAHDVEIVVKKAPVREAA